MKRKQVLPYLLLLTLGLLHSQKVFADQIDLNSNSISVKTKEVNISPTKTQPYQKMNPVKNIIDSLDKITITRSSLTLNDSILSFKNLNPTDPLLRNNMISTSSTTNAILLIKGNLPLNKQEGLLPETSCDNGDCTASNPSLWSNGLTYGIGYRCESIDFLACKSLFSDLNDYAQIPQKVSEGILLSSPLHANASQERRANFIYKINIANTQPTGDYTANIQYILFPTL